MKDFTIIKNAFGSDMVQAFYYDIFNRKIELFFDGYYDTEREEFIEGSCSFIIEDWKEAYSIPYDIDKKSTWRYHLDKNMAIFFRIMDMKFEDDVFEIVINTIDEKYVTYIFESPKIGLVKK